MKKITVSKIKKVLKNRGPSIYTELKSFSSKAYRKGVVLANSENDFELCLKIIDLLEGTQYFKVLKEKSLIVNSKKQKDDLFEKSFMCLSGMAPDGYSLEYKGSGIGFFKDNCYSSLK